MPAPGSRRGRKEKGHYCGQSRVNHEGEGEGAIARRDFVQTGRFVDPPDADSTPANAFYHEQRTYRIRAMTPFSPVVRFCFVDLFFMFLLFMLKIQPRTSGRPERKEKRPHGGMRAKKARRTIQGRARPKEYEEDSVIRAAEGSVGYHEGYPLTWCMTLLP